MKCQYVLKYFAKYKKIIHETIIFTLGSYWFMLNADAYVVHKNGDQLSKEKKNERKTMHQEEYKCLWKKILTQAFMFYATEG